MIVVVSCSQLIVIALVRLMICLKLLLLSEKVIRELSGVILTRGPKLCNFVEWRGFKVVYKRYMYSWHNEDVSLSWRWSTELVPVNTFCRYASLYFCMCIDQDDNELEILEIIQHYVVILDRYFGSVSKVVFTFYKITKCIEAYMSIWLGWKLTLVLM